MTRWCPHEDDRGRTPPLPTKRAHSDNVPDVQAGWSAQPRMDSQRSVLQTAPGFNAVLGNPPWVLYAGKGKQPIDPREEEFLKAVHGRAAKTLSTHGLFAVVAGRLCAPGARIGLVLPTSVVDAERYGDVRAAHDELCHPEEDLLDFGEGAFAGVFQPCMALVSTRRSQNESAGASGAPWRLSRHDLGFAIRVLLDQLDALPKLPPELFGERGYRSSQQDEGKFVKESVSRPPYDTPLFEGTSVREFELLGPTAYADASQLSEVRRTDKWSTVEVFIRQTARYPIACVSARRPFRNSVLAGFGRGPYTAEFLIAYLNSTPIRWFHCHKQRDAQQGMPQVKIGHLRALPAPSAQVLAGLAEIGRRLSAVNRGVSEPEREELDREVASGLGLGSEALGRIRAWGRANPPPLARETAAPIKDLAKSRGRARLAGGKRSETG
jgi:hypothetical protein